MLYAILCYDSEDVVGSWTKEEDDAVMAKLAVVQQKLADQGRLGPVLGFYVVECSTLDEAVETARDLARASSSAGAFEIRPLSVFRPGSVRT